MAALPFPKFFITHSWRDNEFAQRLTDDLKAKGLEGFFDVYSIQPGDNIPSRISTGLEDCDVYIPILSAAAFDSPWCEWEVNAAIQLRNTRGRNGVPRIIPVLIDHCEAKIPAILRPVAYVDFTNSYMDGINRLLVRGLGVDAAKLERRPTGDQANRQATAYQSTKTRSVPKPIVLIGAGVLVIALILLGVYFVGDPTIGVSPLTFTPSPQLTRPGTQPTGVSASTVVVGSPTASPLFAPPTPPISIESAMCPEPRFTNLTSPTNGSGLTGMVQVRGSVVTRPSAQPYRYSLFYREGIVRDAMDAIADSQAVVNPTIPNGKNIPIQVTYFQPFDGPINDGLLGSWDTTKMASGWYSLRLWTKDRAGNFAGCDAYVYVKGQ